MDKPDFPEWASEAEGSDIEEPTTFAKEQGIGQNLLFPRQWLNWTLRQVGRFLTWLDFHLEATIGKVGALEENKGLLSEVNEDVESIPYTQNVFNDERRFIQGYLKTTFGNPDFTEVAKVFGPFTHIFTISVFMGITPPYELYFISSVEVTGYSLVDPDDVIMFKSAELDESNGEIEIKLFSTDDLQDLAMGTVEISIEVRTKPLDAQ